MDEIVRLIFDACDQVDRQSMSGTLGEKLLKMAEKVTEPMKKDPEGIDDEVTEKIYFLKECESNSDLCWMDYNSWNQFTKAFQDKFIEEVNPLFWGALYFQYSKFLEIVPKLSYMMSFDLSVYVLTESKNYKATCIGSDGAAYDRLGPMALKKIQKKYNTTLVLAMGVNLKREFIIKEHNKELLT